MTEFNIEALTEDIQKHSKFVETLKINLHNTIVGQDDLIEKLIIAILSDGHVFLEGVPGLAKTLTVKTYNTQSNRTCIQLCSFQRCASKFCSWSN